MNFIVNLTQKKIPENIGGKGESLMKMCQAGFHVPKGYIICADAWENHILKEKAKEELRLLIEKLPENNTYAVRSSALDEDGKEHSFAGAYETRLKVSRSSIMEAVEAVAASARSERVKSYVENHFGNKEEADKMAIVIQQYMEPEYAGVLFTADVITGSSAKMIGNYVKGCGEQLVSGEADAQKFTFDAMKYAYEGTEEFRPYAKKLYRYATKLRNLYQCPVDIEWAVSGHKLYLLQARPITTLKRFCRDTYDINGSLAGEYLFSRTNVGEIFLCPVSPVTYSILEMICEMLGIPCFIDNICGQAYCNISILCSLLISFGLSKKKAYEMIKDIAGALPDGVEIPVFPFDRRAFLKNIRKMVFGKKVKFDKEITQISRKEFQEHMGEIGDHLIQGIRRQTTNTSLKQYWETHCNAYLSRVLQTLITSISVKPLLRTRQQLTDIAGEELANVLCSNSSQNGILESMKPMLALEDVIAGNMSQEEYIKLYGHRSVNEMELICPYPYEDPDYMEEKIRQHKKSGICVHQLKKEQEKRYQKAVEEFKQKYPLKAKWLDKKLDVFATANLKRERVRSQSVKLFCLMREFLLKTAELNNMGEGVFMLYMQETLAFLGGDSSVLEKIPERRKQYELYCNYPNFPNIIVGRFQPEEWLHNPDRRTDVWLAGGEIEQSGEIKGYAGAAGVVEGTVRILMDPNEAIYLKKGEILVTTATNIGWTTVFSRAAAIVTDIGAPLSHAAIVAREFGIPAVVGCGNATEVLKTGDRVRVDGVTGVVRILDV